MDVLLCRYLPWLAGSGILGKEISHGIFDRIDPATTQHGLHKVSRGINFAGSLGLSR